MIRGKKIFNDPVYGFISVPYGVLFDIIEHPYFQRLRRIRQVGLTDIVYPGALHTRYSHALGAFHLMNQAIQTLRMKGVDITPQEEEAVCVAILLHDIGHGPISHALEFKIVPKHHEEISALLMNTLNEEFGGRLTLALRIFSGDYPKQFLSQLVSGQLDMDRMDYLNRDSFFTGVSEGVIGYHRIIKMLNVFEGRLVVEEKGLYSIEKFLVARRLMYWQVYLHKTVLSAEQMLSRAVARARDLLSKGVEIPMSENLAFFLKSEDASLIPGWVDRYARLDDTDIMYSLKLWVNSSDLVLKRLAEGLIDRRLFKCELRNEPIPEKDIAIRRSEVQKNWAFPEEDLKYLVFTGIESNNAYNIKNAEIEILMKSGVAKAFSEVVDHSLDPKIIKRYYLCYPKN
ncbi:MAG: HD domain-containing protein [Saprospiraceae bacterium]|nr:HD domain-containing protein [Saprospiraceae bacterium]